MDMEKTMGLGMDMKTTTGASPSPRPSPSPSPIPTWILSANPATEISLTRKAFSIISQRIASTIGVSSALATSTVHKLWDRCVLSFLSQLLIPISHLSSAPNLASMRLAT